MSEEGQGRQPLRQGGELIQRCRGRVCGTAMSRLSSLHMYVLAHTWPAGASSSVRRSSQKEGTKNGAAVRLSRMQVQLAVQTK